MARRLLTIAATAVGVLMLSHETDALFNSKRLTTLDDTLFQDRPTKPISLRTTAVRAASPVQEAFYEQAVLDHNAPASQQKFWKQRYLINQDFWGGKGFPVFFHNGGESRLKTGRVDTESFAHVLAQKHKALLVALEHRFYGDSIPNGDLSLENLQYLTSAQQLADVARFHGFLTKKMGLENSKWVAFGGSYSGSLAAWEKLKYPSLFAGAIASSAPLVAQTNFFEYNEVVGRSLRFFGGDACYNRIQQGVVDFRKLVDGGNATKSQLQKMFPMCDPIENDLDLSVYESQISGPFGNLVQTNDKVSFRVADLCTYFANATRTPLELLSAFVVPSGDCLNSKFEGNANGFIEFFKDTTRVTGNLRQWFYQTCNEFGWYVTTTSKNSPFYALKSQTEKAMGLELCKRVYNIDAVPVAKTNAVYGGLDIKVENVTFVSGSIDPWIPLSVTHATRPNADADSVVDIVGTSHATDIFAPRENSIPALTAAQAKIAANVAKYIGVPQ